MDTINRLQFRHHDEIFTGATLDEARAAAIGYISGATAEIRNATTGLAASDDNNYGVGTKYGYSLFSEPTILRYSTPGSAETDPHIILAIGSVTNDKYNETGEVWHSNNKFCIIDIDKTEGEIEDLREEIEKIIKSLNIITIDSDSLDLESKWIMGEGIYLSGDVKTTDHHAFSASGGSKPNSLMIASANTDTGSEGLFIYVDLKYDESTETFTFYTSLFDGTLKEVPVKLPNNYLVSGEYKKEDESIHLHMKNGDEVLIDCEQLIDEWKVEGDASMTPIVLTREEVGPDGEPYTDHHHTEPWQDILRGDVRIADFIGTNILKKTTDGRYLYVDGKATNIIYYYNGELSNVSEQLDKLNKIKISADNDNIIWNRTDGFFATTKLEYISNKNKLVFTTSNVSGGTTTKEIQLNSVELFQNVYYDRNTEELVITYKDNEGNLKVIRIPISDMFDEWDVLNDAHSVKLVKSPHHIAGKDILTADVNISVDEDNILEERGEGNIHALFVRGTADNIKYNDTTVEGALDDLATKDTEQDGKIQAIEDEIGDGFGPRATVRDAIDALSANTAASLKHVKNEDKSIDVVERDGVEGKEAVIKINLSGNEPYNTLRLERDGLYNFIDLNYDPDTNKLTLTRSDNSSTENVSKELQLNSVSFIDDITYDPTTETLIITYHSGAEEKKVEINLGQIFQEWEVYNNPDSAVKLNRQRVIDGKDKLSGEVIITTAHTDNILENEHGALYVSGQQIEDNKNAIAQLTSDLADEIARALAAENLLETNLNNEITRAISAETALNNAITTVGTNLQNEIDRATATENRIEAKLDNEITRSTNKDEELYQLIVDEKTRATEADAVLDAKINTASAESFARDAQLQALISGETAARETSDRIINTNLQSEIERSTAEDQRLNNALQQEIADRQQGDAELAQQILDATLKFSPSRNSFESNGTIEFNNYETNDNIVEANVILQGSDDNIIKAGSGIYATVHMSYDIATNKLKLTTSAGSEEFQLAGATVIDNLYYDNESGEIVITYHDGSGNVQTMKFPASELFNEWIVQNPSEKSAIELTKTRATEQGQPDELKGRVLITDDRDGDGKPDEGSDNLIEIRNNGLYVCGSGSTLAQCVSGRTDAIYKTLFGSIAPGGCGEGIEYLPDTLSCVISGATSFAEADRLMAYQICEILEMWVSGMTCTSVSNWVDDGANKKMLVDVRPSHGNIMNGMTDDDLYITDLTGDTIEHGVTEFTDTNALRIVCLEEGGSVIPDITSPQNGIYLSNVWDCGKYYQESTEADEMAEVSADGYNVNYFTDEDTNASSYNYMNNVRQNDTLC